MKSRSGIMMKLFVWYFILLSLLYGTIIVLFMHNQRILDASSTIVDKKFEISALSKKLIENLLSMEENDKKYHLLKKKEYKDYFDAAGRDFEDNIISIIRLHLGAKEGVPWEELYRTFQARMEMIAKKAQSEQEEKDSQEAGKKSEAKENKATRDSKQDKQAQAASGEKAGEATDVEPEKELWIPEAVINEWIQRVSLARAENDRDVELAMRGLHSQGELAVRWGLVGIGASFFVGLLGILFLNYSMVRPLRELRKGIRSISREGQAKPIRILSKDEFGELAFAFNEMITRLKEEERMRSDFISMLSHEIRTPLTSIRESVNLIEEGVMGPVSERQSRFLQIASGEIERITDLLNHLLQVSRIEASGVKVILRPFNPSTLVEDSIKRLTPAAKAKGIGIRAETPSDLPDVLGDKDHVQQVLLNLVGNAVKFSPKDQEVIVSIGRDGDKNELKFSVTDHGPGIREEEKPLVFRKYYRGPGVRDQFDGMGLGLSISKQIIEAQNGRIWVESKLGHGSIFNFTLPLAPVH